MDMQIPASIQTPLRLALKRLQPRIQAQVLSAMQAAHTQAQAALQSADEDALARVSWDLARAYEALLDLPQAQRMQLDAVLTEGVNQNGQLYGVKKWEMFDPLWLKALGVWLSHCLSRNRLHHQPCHIALPGQCRLALAGDWGTDGAIAHAVAQQISQAAPDYSIHLGDVYYAGTLHEEKAAMRHWPAGRLLSFALNSNHEMYSKAHGLRHALKQNIFAHQNLTPYFSMSNQDWLLIGLDSAAQAYYSAMYLDGRLQGRQLHWLKALGAQYRQQRILLLSHHEAWDLRGEHTALYTQVCQALGRIPDFWYWGHAHNAVCYSRQENLYGRCVGHGAIPYGHAKVLEAPDVKDKVAWFESMPAHDAKYPLRVLNGFVQVELDGARLHEKFISEQGAVQYATRDL